MRITRLLNDIALQVIFNIIHEMEVKFEYTIKHVSRGNDANLDDSYNYSKCKHKTNRTLQTNKQKSPL